MDSPDDLTRLSQRMEELQADAERLTAELEALEQQLRCLELDSEAASSPSAWKLSAEVKGERQVGRIPDDSGGKRA